VQFNINLTSLAVILWSGMLIISGSIWVLSSQVRKLADLIEAQQARTSEAESAPSPAPAQATAPILRVYAAPGRSRVVARRATIAQARRVAR
jgi:hypothetical protein